MTDLRDQLAAFEAAAQRLITHRRRRLVLVHATPARCHPDRPVNARGLCDSCYEMHWRNGSLDQFPTQRTIRSAVHFVADYELLRSEGYTRTQIAERLGMNRAAVDQAYRRAVAAGLLTPDRVKAWRRGEASPAARLTDADVREIRRSYAAGEATQAQLGARFGIAQTHVSSIIRGRSWTHVTPIRRTA